MKTMTQLLLLAFAAFPFLKTSAQSCDPADTLDHWISHQIPPPADGDVFYYLCDVVDEQTLWGMAGAGQFCRSTDGGCTWTTGKVNDPVDFNLGTMSFSATGTEEAWAVFYDFSLAAGRHGKLEFQLPARRYRQPRLFRHRQHCRR